MKTPCPNTKQRILPWFFIFFLLLGWVPSEAQINAPVVLGYFPSWSETDALPGQNSVLRSVPPHVNYVFLAFAKPELKYVKGSYDIKGTGVQVPYDGCSLKETVASLKARGTHVILSIGGETYWVNPSDYDNINYQTIKDFVDDMGFVGIDWDFEPAGSFTDIGNATNVQLFKDFIHQSRLVMPRSAGYLIACAPSGVGALGGQSNDDPASPFRYSQRNVLTGETDANLWQPTVPTNGINLFGFSATGHMIPVMNAVGNDIDLIAFQSYNCGASTNRNIMYDAYAYYAEKYGFKLAAGTHYPPEPWGPYYTYNHQTVAAFSKHIRDYPTRVGDNDGIMLWQLLLSGPGSSGYSYMNVASQVLNGASEATAIANATVFPTYTYTGGVQGCGGQTYCGASIYNSTRPYPTAGTKVVYNCAIWSNAWFANPGEVPGASDVWKQQGTCSEAPGCSTSTCNTTASSTIQACQSYTTPSGKVLTSTGVYSDIIPNKAKCDSIITINLTVTVLTPSVQLASTTTLKASISGASYQWIDCSKNASPIPGATAETYSPTASGSYAVKVTTNGCSATSPCFSYTLGQTPCVATTKTFNQQSCLSYISPSGNTYTISGIYQERFRSMGGCDSIVNLNLTITTLAPEIQRVNNAITVNVLGAAYQWLDCGNNSLAISGATTQSYSPPGAGIYAVRVTKGGCSVTSSCFSYTVPPPPCAAVTKTISQQGCQSYTSPSGNTYTVSGIYQERFRSMGGCDSIVNLNLTITTLAPEIQRVNNAITVNVSGAVYQWLDCGNNSLAISGATTQSYSPPGAGIYAVRVTKGGCSAISSCFSYTVPPPPCAAITKTINQQGCQSYTSPSGNTYTVSGVYQERFRSMGGCDSIVNLNLTITTLAPEIQRVNNAMTVNVLGAAYQWLDCGNNSIAISGVTTQSYSPPGAGIYAVRVTKGGCSVTSSCFSYTVPPPPCAAVTKTINQQGCQSYTSPSGNTYTVSGVYQERFRSMGGCDSIVNLNLTITTLAPEIQRVNNGITVNVSGAAYQWLNCGNNSIAISGVTTQSYSPPGAGIYAVRVTKGGCSAISSCFSYTVPPPPCAAVTKTISQQGCQSYTSPSGNTYTVSGVYQERFRSMDGCDSIVNLNLTITSLGPEVSRLNTMMAVNVFGAMYQWLDCGNNSLAIPGATAQTYTPQRAGIYAVRVTKGGCSATSPCFSYTLASPPPCAPVTQTIHQQACQSYTSPAGHTYTVEGIYSDTLLTATGCDSVLQIYLSMVPLKAQIQELSNCCLMAVLPGGNYQWFDCNLNMAAVPGATLQSYVPLANGNYAVKITKDGCTGLSECESFYHPGLGISEQAADHQIVLAPNPAHDEVTIRTEGANGLRLKRIVFYSTIGTNVIDQDLEPESAASKLQFHLPAGLYFVEIYVNDGKMVRRLIVE